jgi:precorrin-6A/cobalt-precorrin-6A reductase
MRILILGGTEDARLLAEQLVAMGHQVTSSLAGKTSEPLLPKGEVRIGGFGGGDGLGNYLVSNKFDRIVDATHPYATQIKVNAVRGAEIAGMRLVRLTRPPWTEPQYAFWKHFANAEDAAAALPPGARALLTIGHGLVAPFLARNDCSFVVRSIEPPAKPLPAHATSLIDRPPYFPGGETTVLESNAITHLVTKNSGGAQTEAKLGVATQLRLPVFIIDRPALPPAHEVPTVGQAIAALRLG